ncbi:MAG: ribose-5-phosphate isomerase RpiA [Methylococcaceae bacterium]|nr:ribose-5-phosphate isomerase RpiA [Methylococcaceae bacterium]
MSDKQAVAIHAANFVEDGMLIGLGTGSTANYFIEELARRKKEDNLQFSTVASSMTSMIKAQQMGLELIPLENVRQLDLYVDGADEVTPDKTLLKGRGFDLVKEKLLAKASEQFYVLIDNSKLVSRIGENYPIPIEVAPFSWQMVLRSLQQVGGEGGLRLNASGDGLVTTSHGSLVLDMVFDPSLEGDELNAALNSIPGAVEHGIFYQLATHIFMGKGGEVEER